MPNDPEEPTSWRREAGPLQLYVRDTAYGSPDPDDDPQERYEWSVTAACGCCGYKREGTAAALVVALEEAMASAGEWLDEGALALARKVDSVAVR
jgi:hypothetical protein